MLASTIKFSKHTPQKPPDTTGRPLGATEKPQPHKDHRPLKTQQRATTNMVKANVPPRNQKHDQPPEKHPGTNQPHTKNWLLRKEVIQPHLPVRLPCYDFVPIANPTFDHSPHQTVVRPWASGVTNFHDVTGGVYKARERIHRSIADLRLLATPTSWGRVADPNPN